MAVEALEMPLEVRDAIAKLEMLRRAFQTTSKEIVRTTELDVQGNIVRTAELDKLIARRELLAATYRTDLEGVNRVLKARADEIRAAEQATIATERLSDADAKRLAGLSATPRNPLLPIGDAMAKNRMLTQSATYAMQDFVQGLSVGSFSMAVRGAANNLEMLGMALTVGKSAALGMAAALGPSALLIGVSLAEAFSKRATPAVKESTDASRNYRQELERLQGVAAGVVESENAIANATERRSFAQRRADLLNKITKDEIEVNLQYERTSLFGIRNYIAKDQATMQKADAEYKAYVAATPAAGRLERQQWMNLHNVRFGGAFARLESARPDLVRLAGQREMLAKLDAEREQAQGRANAQQLIGANRGKLVELASKLRKGGVGRAAIESQVADAIGAGDKVTPDIARRAAKLLVDEADLQRDLSPWKKADAAWQDQIGALELRANNARNATRDAVAGRKGKFAVGQLEAAEREASRQLDSAKAQRDFWKGVADSQIGVMVEIKALLQQIAANTAEGRNDPPRNDFIRNNANVINPFHWIPGIGR